MTISQLHILIEAVCPIEGINSNGVIWFKSSATAQQKIDAQAIMNANISSLVF